MKITAENAKTAAGYLERNGGNAAQAAHDVDLSRQAIRPYTSQPLEQSYRVLRNIANLEADGLTEKAQQWRTTLAAIAAK